MSYLAIGAAVIAAGVATYSIVKGAKQKKKAGKIARENIRPSYEIGKPYKDNQALAENRAGQGLSDASKQAYMTNADRGLSSSVNAILKAGGNPNLVSGAYDEYETEIGKFALADDAARLNNIQTYMKSNSDMGELLDKQWQINKYAPYADKAQLAAYLMQQGDKNIDSGVNQIGQIGMSYLGGSYGGGGAKGAKGGGGDATLRGANQPVAGGTQSLNTTPNMPNNITIPNQVANYNSGTYFINSTGYSPQMSNRSSNYMQGLGMNSLNTRGQMETNQQSPWSSYDWNSLFVNQIGP